MQNRQRATFEADELAVVLSHYDLGVVESITEFAKGSSRSPKVGVVCERGKFLLKRRAPERADADRTRFCHGVQRYLHRSGFPVPGLIPTRSRNQTILQVRERLYELFEFVPGQPYRRTVEEARDAGVTLGRFHQAIDSIPSMETLALRAPRGDYHDAPGVRTGLCGIGSTLTAHDSFAGDEAELAGLIQFLLEAYERAADEVNCAGLAKLKEGIIHADWHPGNLLFREGRVAAVVDFDSARWSKRIIDIANGLLQFSMRGEGDPRDWPDEVDTARAEAFLSGYQSQRSLASEERRCLRPLMIESLIAECLPPIARTGSVGRWTGFRVLGMIRRKVAWLERERPSFSNEPPG